MTTVFRRVTLLLAVALCVLSGANSASAARGAAAHDHGQADVFDLSLDTLGPLPADPSNRFADDRAAAEFGHRLFFDPRLSADGRVSCATCHDPRKEFQDGIPLGKGVGTTDRRTMPVAATAHSPFLFWDGRKDSQWAQALGPLESPVEHGGSRALYAHVVAEHHRADYERVFGRLPELRGIPRAAGPVPDAAARKVWEQLSQQQRDEVTRVFVNIGKAIAAYERQIGYAPSRFDQYVTQWKKTGTAPRNILTADEAAGLSLFVGKANCTQCHNGPLITNNEFHNTGVPQRAGLPADSGRVAGVRAVQADEFNCRSRWSDAGAKQCAELDFLTPPGAEQRRAYKVPSLRNVAERAPYMHAGQFATLAEVLDHYNRAPAAPAGTTELKPLGLNRRELQQLEAFLRSLSGGVAGPAGFLAPPVGNVAQRAAPLQANAR